MGYGNDLPGPAGQGQGAGRGNRLLIVFGGLVGLACLGCLSLGVGIFLATRPIAGVPAPATSTAQPAQAVVEPSTATPGVGTAAPWDAILQRATPAPPTVAPGEATPEAATEPLATYHSIVDYPGPPGEPQPVTLPPHQTDQTKIERAKKLYDQGMAAFDADKWEPAIDLFDQVLELNPWHAGAYNYRGAAYRHLGPHNYLDVFLEHNELAIEDFTRAIAADPTWWRSYHNRAGSYGERAQVEPLRSERRKWLDLALADMERALELDPTQGWPSCNRANIYLMLGECDKGVADAHRCNTESASTLLSWGYRCKGDYRMALSLIAGPLAASPQDYSLLCARGEVFLAQGEYQKALDDFEAAAASWQGDFVPGALYFRQAAAEYYLGHYDRVKELILEGEPKTWVQWGSAYYYLGMVLLEEGDTETAIEALLWAEQTMDEGDPVLPAARQQLAKLAQPVT